MNVMKRDTRVLNQNRVDSKRSHVACTDTRRIRVTLVSNEWLLLAKHGKKLPTNGARLDLGL